MRKIPNYVDDAVREYAVANQKSRTNKLVITRWMQKNDLLTQEIEEKLAELCFEKNNPYNFLKLMEDRMEKKI